MNLTTRVVSASMEKNVTAMTTALPVQLNGLPWRVGASLVAIAPSASDVPPRSCVDGLGVDGRPFGGAALAAGPPTPRLAPRPIPLPHAPESAPPDDPPGPPPDDPPARPRGRAADG